MVAQLRHMESVERPAASAAIAEARDKGDLSENSEYDAAKEAQAMLEMKINNLKAAIAEAKIIDTSKLQNDVVQILSTVQMKNVKNGMVMKYTIVSESEANLKEGKISSTTPIAQGLLGKRVGDVVDVKIPQGTIQLEILNISIDYFSHTRHIPRRLWGCAFFVGPKYHPYDHLLQNHCRRNPFL